MKLIKKGIYHKADKLVRKGFKELKATNKFTKCDSIAVKQETQEFWFTTENIFNQYLNNKI